jgi:anaerobic ribonucleoside-triphosphate reductase activating protein
MKDKFNLKMLGTYKETVVDGEGLRYSIYFSGCTHSCKGCHNKESWCPDNGKLVNLEYLEEIVNEINSNPLLDGITLSGGDPLYNPEEMLEIVKYLKEKTGMNIWLYTGYTIEELRKDNKRMAVLEYVDTIVDGKFVQELYDPLLKFRGSSNQRIIRKKDFK